MNVTLDKKSRLDILKVAEFENGDEDEDGEGEVTWTRMDAMKNSSTFFFLVQTYLFKKR